jgi:DNA-dependent RNA polymerase auxiliary subunit epsilon
MHFIGLCFGNYWEDNIIPYCENEETDSYIEYTKSEAIQQAKRMHQKRYDYAKQQLEDNSYNIEFYQNILTKGNELSDEEAWEIAKTWGYEIDENDNLLSKYNPDAKWDRYQVGGRWANELILKERTADGDLITTDQAEMGEIDWDLMFEKKRIPFCFVTIKGEWLECGDLGFVEYDYDQWYEIFIDYIKTLKEDDLVTVIDFHI